MSIDARIYAVICNEDGSGELKLVDRPSIKGAKGIAGQPCLAFKMAPYEITCLNGLDIWGGDSTILLGDIRIGHREGWGGIRFVEQDELQRAVKVYYATHEKRGACWVRTDEEAA